MKSNQQSIQSTVIKKVQATDHNDQIPFQQIYKTHPDFVINTHVVYYPYNNLVNDQGWGCAWRAIQTLLSSRGHLLSFDQLFYSFSQKIHLLQILNQHQSCSQQLIQILQNQKWAPNQNQSHWAEPFIASIVCIDYKIPHSLVVLNGYPHAYAPKQAFERLILFQQFRYLIKQNIGKGSIMIDDGNFALSIIGYRSVEHSNKFQLLFADPHIKSNQQDKSVGLYTELFDEKGRSVAQSLSQAQKKEALYQVYKKLDFQKKFWMICVCH